MQNSKSSQIIFLSQIGPALITTTLLIQFAALSPQVAYLPFAALVGLFLCSAYSNKGAIAATVMLVATAILSQSFGKTDTFFHLGMLLVMVLGFYLTAQATEETRSLLTQRPESPAAAAHFSETLDEIEGNYTRLVQKLRAELDEARTQLNAPVQMTPAAPSYTTIGPDPYATLVTNALLNARTTGIIITQTAAQLASEAVANSVPDTTTNIEESGRVRELKAQLAQLRQQFEEKSEVLTDTRKELYRLESQLLAREQSALLASPEPTATEVALERTVRHIETEKNTLEQTANSEIDVLSDLVNQLLQELAETKAQERTA